MNSNGNISTFPHVIIEQAANGDQRAFKEIYNSLSGKMYSLCLRYALDTDTANDYFQEGFIKLFRNLPNYRFEGSFEGWARRIFVTVCLDELRKKKISYDEINDDINIVSKEISVHAKLDMLDLIKLLQKIPDSYRTIVNLYIIEGYSHKEIAEILNITENGSKSKLHKARIYLKKLLGTQESE